MRLKVFVFIFFGFLLTKFAYSQSIQEELERQRQKAAIEEQMARDSRAQREAKLEKLKQGRIFQCGPHSVYVFFREDDGELNVYYYVDSNITFRSLGFNDRDKSSTVVKEATENRPLMISWEDRFNFYEMHNTQPEQTLYRKVKGSGSIYEVKCFVKWRNGQQVR
jgi:hypothetical protein